MPVARLFADAFRMTETVWTRHANPWSVWTRYFSLPLLTVAIWSHVWWGWGAIAPILGALLWIWVNPRLFPPPRSTDHWASKAVLGERVWLNRQAVLIPAHHQPVIRVTIVINTIGSGLWFGGMGTGNLELTGLGIILVILGKSWFLDRMVWLYDEMKDRHPPYQAWLY